MNRRSFLLRSGMGGLGSCLTSSFLPGPTLFEEKVKPVDELVDAATTEAIQKGLAYLASRQVREGRFQGAFGTKGYAGGVAVTSLCGLAFLCSGSTPYSGQYDRQIQRCIDFVLKNVRGSGYISENGGTQRFSNMYGHGYAMLFLSQVAGMSKKAGIREKLESAIALTSKVQNQQGGWRYRPVKADADLSITVCQIMALRAAHNAGFEVSNDVRKKTIEYVDRCRNKDGSFRYMAGKGRTTLALTSAAVVSYYSAGLYDDPRVNDGLKWIFDHRPGRASGQVVSPMNYYYAHYYAIQAMWHAQLYKPEYWNQWYPLIRDELLYRKRSNDGTWPDAKIGPEFATAMSCIILQIPFNFLPVFAP